MSAFDYPPPVLPPQTRDEHRLAQRLHHTESCLERIAFRDGECECGQGLFVEGAEGKGAEGRPFDLLLARYRVECRRRELAEERLADTAPFLRLLMKVSLETREVVVQQQSWPLLETLADKAEKAVKKCQGVQVP